MHLQRSQVYFLSKEFDMLTVLITFCTIRLKTSGNSEIAQFLWHCRYVNQRYGIQEYSNTNQNLN